MTQVGTLTGSLVEVCDFLFDKMVDNKANLGLADVFFGDQDRLPTTPVVCIEPGIKRNLLRQAAGARMLDVVFELTILVYHSFITSPQENRRGADALAEAIEAVVHSDRTLGNRVIHGYCPEIQSGYTTKSGSLVRANKVSYSAQSQYILPS